MIAFSVLDSLALHSLKVQQGPDTLLICILKLSEIELDRKDLFIVIHDHGDSIEMIAAKLQHLKCCVTRPGL